MCPLPDERWTGIGLAEPVIYSRSMRHEKRHHTNRQCYAGHRLIFQAYNLEIFILRKVEEDCRREKTYVGPQK
jgi:hypothetical protein